METRFQHELKRHNGPQAKGIIMKYSILTLMLFFSVATAACAGEVKRVPIAELDTVMIQTQGLLLNNFNFVIEEALMGGIKATAQCTGKNKSQDDLNYTVYIAAFDKGGALIACFGLEPGMNIHEAGKIETLETSGMVDSAHKGKIDHVLLKVVVQSPSE